MTTHTTHPSGTTTPNDLATAIAGSVIVNIVSLVSFLLPGQDEVPDGAKIGALVLAVLAAIGAWGLWQRRRWGQRLTLVVTVLNALSAVPALFDPPSGAIAAVVGVALVVGVVTVSVLARPTLRSQLA